MQVPGGWRHAAALVNRSTTDDGKALVLPLLGDRVHASWGFSGVDALARDLLERPVLTAAAPPARAGRAYVRLVRRVERAIVGQDPGAVLDHLQVLGISHVVVRHDLAPVSQPGGGGVVHPRLISSGLGQVDGLRRVDSNAAVDVFAVERHGFGIVQALPAGRRGDRGRRTVPGIRSRGADPSRHEVTIRGASGRFVLALAETYSREWQLSGLPRAGTARHRRLDGYRNGWLIDASGDLRLHLEHAPAHAALVARRASGLAAAALVAALLVQFEVRRRRPLAAGRPRLPH